MLALLFASISELQIRPKMYNLETPNRRNISKSAALGHKRVLQIIVMLIKR